MQLTREDLGKLQAKPRLLEYLVEKPKQPLHMSIEEPPVPCARLKRYRKVAKNVMDMLAGIDQLSHGPSPYRGLANDQLVRESYTADLIRRSDRDLPGMLMVAKIAESETPAICQLYARVVMGHENDQDCDQIVDELIRLGFSIRAGTCR